MLILDYLIVYSSQLALNNFEVCATHILYKYRRKTWKPLNRGLKKIQNSFVKAKTKPERANVEFRHLWRPCLKTKQHGRTKWPPKTTIVFKCTLYLANSASCFGSLRSMPGKPSGGSFFPVMYSEKSGWSSSWSRSWFLSSAKKQNAH